jgi:hypothetical protein
MVVEKASGRVPGRAPGSSRSRDDDGGGLQYVSWKRDPSFRFFPSKGNYRRKGSVRGWTRAAHPLVARPDPSLPRRRVWPAPGPLRLIFGLCEASVKIEGLAFVSSNSENISCLAFLKHKNSRNRNWHCGISLIG